MAFSRSRSLLHEFTPLFRLLEHHKAIHPARIAARFVPAAACSTAHTTGRVTKLSDHHHHHHHGVHPWRRRHWWGWGWGWDPAAADWNMGTHGVRPDIDMVEKGDAYVIEADLPGVKKGDVNVRVGDGGWSLSVEGRRGATTGSSEKTEGESRLGKKNGFGYVLRGLTFFFFPRSCKMARKKRARLNMSTR